MHMKSIIDKIVEDNPLFHDDFQGNLITWNSNINLLRSLEKMIKPEMVTLETGSGYSSVMFISNKCHHTSISPVKEESLRISTYCKDAGISLDDVKFLIGESHEILPTLAKDSFDVIFIDGAHRFPFPIVDWFFSSLLLKENGLIVIDDTDIISCHIVSQFLANDSHWETVDIRENFGIFRKKGNHDYPSDWLGQIFSRQKITKETDVLKAFYPENNWDEQMKQSH